MASIKKFMTTELHCYPSEKLRAEFPDIELSRSVYTHEQAQQILKELLHTNPLYALGWRIQLQTGCRLRELAELRADDLQLVKSKGKAVGIITLHGKGGHLRDAIITKKLYTAIQFVFENRITLLSRNGYRAAVRRAANKLGLKYAGTHGVRRLVAQGLKQPGYQDLQEKELPSKEKAENMLE
jgi:integrase